MNYESTKESQKTSTHSVLEGPSSSASEDSRSEEAEQYFGRAVVRDPKFSRAYVGLADCLIISVDYGYLNGVEALPKAREYLTKAIEPSTLAWPKHMTR